MNYKRVIIAIIIMALFTYIPRMLPIVVFKKKITNKFIQSFLAYVPYSVFAAMTFPAVIKSTGTVTSAVGGILVAIILAYRGKSMLTIALSTIAVAYIIEQIIRFVA